MKTPIRFTALALSMMLASGFASAADIKVGVSMSAFDDTFLTYLREDMDKQAKSYPKGDGVQLQFEDARADVVKQLSQVENFISQKGRRHHRQPGRHGFHQKHHQRRDQGGHPAGVRQPPSGPERPAQGRSGRDLR